jgi:hypothetical protein
LPPAFLGKVGQTFLSAGESATVEADRNVCPTRHIVVDFRPVVRIADKRFSIVGLEEPRDDLNRLRPAEADNPPCRAPGRRGDGGNGVVQRIHAKLLI